MAQTIYAVSSGDYDGHQINRLFSTEALAKAWVAMYAGATGDDAYFIEPFVVDDDDDLTDLTNGWTYWQVIIYDTGRTYATPAIERVLKEPEYHEYPALAKYNGKYPASSWTFFVQGTDMAHAITVATAQLDTMRAHARAQEGK